MQRNAYDLQKWQQHFLYKVHEFSTSNESSLLKKFINFPNEPLLFMSNFITFHCKKELGSTLRPREEKLISLFFVSLYFRVASLMSPSIISKIQEQNQDQDHNQ